MSVINSQPLIGASGNQGGAYNLTRSLRFRSSATAFLNRTPASASNRRTWTWSAWVKRGALGGAYYMPFGADAGSGTGAALYFFNDFLHFGQGATTYRITSAVFRDPSAWYHVVLTLDTTQATANNRVRIYVNGQEVTSFSTLNNPTQNQDLAFNNNVPHAIGADIPNSGARNFFDGYMTEMHFIDGQALTPSDFGETDTATGVWKPKKYTGTYGTNGFYLPFSLNQTASHSASLNGSSQYLSFPNSSNFAFGTGAFTIEGWLNGTNAQADKFLVGGRSAIGTLHITTGGSATSTTAGCLRYVGSSTITSGNILVSTGTWTHWAVTRDGSNNVKLWINGQEVGSGTDTTNYSTTSGTWFVGVNDVNTAAGLLAGNVSNLRIVKGSAVYTAKFAPPSANLTAISGTSLLTLQSSTIVDNSGNSVSITNTGSIAMSVDYPFSSNVSYDASGNNNNWVANNISLTSGSTYDSMKDVPTLTDADTANYCTLNPLSATSGTFSRANLRYVGPSSDRRANGTMAVSTGKWYWEVTLGNAPFSPRSNSTQYNSFGFGVSTAFASTTGPTTLTDAVILTDAGFYKNFSGSYTDGGTAFSSGDVLSIAVDLDANTYTFYRNNSQLVTGTIGGTAGRELVPVIISYNGDFGVMDANFGQRPFAYTPPSGFKALNTFNLPTPTIGATASTQANKYFDISLYTGNGTSQSIVNAGFKPDFVWVKPRNTTNWHELEDSVRGIGNNLYSNTTNAEDYLATRITSLNSDGFSVGSASGINGNGNSNVAWQWRASNATAVSNTSGTITSTVSANTSAGFSIVTYSGSGSAGTVGHGLGVAPSMVIVKSRVTGSGGSGYWMVYHSATGNTRYLLLNSTDASATSSGVWNNTTPTSSVFSIGTSGDVSGSGGTFVAYCFAEVAGYSKFGSYTGNGSTDGPFIYTGFRPKFYLYKRTDTTASWVILDAQRNTSNIVTNILAPNLANAESSFDMVDFCSNGIKIRNNFNADNGNGGTFIYAAFAENPFKYSLAR